MKKILLFSIFCLVLCSSLYSQNLKSPQEFLRTNYGKHFTPHHLLVDYVYHVAENSNRVNLEEYGRTNEDRPLLMATISSSNNLNQVEEIRNSHLAGIGMVDPSNRMEKEFAIVWLSFGVHGNEAGGSESSMNVLYELSNPENMQTGKWLDNTVVIFDPSLNPDGYNRYTQWVRGIGGKIPHPGLTDREHMEPWPGGRVNHYYFDLNRDWAWQTQVESQQRIAKYRTWMPHVHVDFHEMGYDNGYYFAPAAEPYHKCITDFQRIFQVDIGKNHAKYFDKEGWLYFTREVFDLFYPSYGDTYPTFNGAVGMTYEQAGHGMAGRAISLPNGDTLTIEDRITHHTTTGLSTVEEASKQAKRLNDNFRKYFDDAVNSPKGKYRSYIIKQSEKADRLTALLDKNNIQYYRSATQKSIQGYAYHLGTEAAGNIENGDIIINANQPNGTLLQILMEPEPVLSDSITYDITAWSLPHIYGVDAYALEGYTSMKALQDSDMKIPPCFASEGTNSYAYVFPWKSVNSAKLLSDLYKEGVNVRLAQKDIKFDSGVVPRGAFAVVRGDNYHIDDLQKVLIKYAMFSNDCLCLSSGFSSEGGDVGSSAFRLLKHPKALLFSGRNTSPYGVGQVWYFFDEVLGYPLSIVDIDNFNRVDMDDYNTIILPDGYYSLDENQLKKVREFASNGGKVIAISGALGNLVGKDGFALSKYATDDEKSAAKKERESMELAARKDSYEDQERRGRSNSIPGAVIRNDIDDTHPLAFGLGNQYHSLKTSRQHYNLLKDAWNVITVPKDYKHYGFIGSNAKSKFEDSVSFAVEDKGRGTVIYMVDNPLFRGFWDNGLLLFSNALFLVD